MRKMLKIEHVSKTFNLGTINEKKALIDINLQLDDGDFVTVIGGNGAGKSTLMNMIAGVYPIDCVHIKLDDKDILYIQNINVQVLLVVYSRIR
jgi:putative ABC transport system ATP-binding protein